jgi:multiple sugar transport system substrate-binding protein
LTFKQRGGTLPARHKIDQARARSGRATPVGALARDAAATPEGPYETTPGLALANTPSNRGADYFIEIFEQLQDEVERTLGLKAGQREIRMILFLVRNHLAGRLVTSSTLAEASGLTYGTAMRAIEAMAGEGLIVKRSRTSTGKSFSLHPSSELLSRWHRFAFQANTLARAVAEPPDARAASPSRKLRASAKTAAIVPPPPVLNTKLSLARGLRVLVHGDPTFMAMHSAKKQFEMILGVPISSRALSIDRLQAELTANAGLPHSRYDLVACDLPWFGEMASEGRLLPLNGFIQKNSLELGDIYADALASSRWRGVQYGVPIMTTAEALVYRADLLAAAGVEPPRTAYAAVEAARRLHNPASGVSGIAWNGARGTPVGHTFIMVMAAFGQPVLNLAASGDGFDAEHVEGEEMRPMFASLEARQTAEYLLELMQYSPPDVLRMAWYERASAYAQGKAAMAYSHSLLAPMYELDSASPAWRKTGYLPHPTGPRGRPITPMGGYGVCIPANIAPERIPAVWTALQALTSASAAKLYLANGSLASPRASVSRDPEIQALSPLIPFVDEAAGRGWLRMWPRPPVPGILDVISIAGEEIHDLLSGAKTVAAALAAAQNRADAVMRARGYY